ncbi:hypothetical protein V2W45_1248355, partial [Cenococcum geophilum]
IPQKKLLLYYTKNPYYLYCYAKIYKPLKDIIIKIAKKDQLKEAPDDHLEDLLIRGTRKRKINYTIDGASKKLKK